jgi:hypothetical protein
MTEKIQKQTAKVLQFPLTSRAGKGSVQTSGRMVVDRPAIADVECGSGWYHDAALHDANKARHN